MTNIAETKINHSRAGFVSCAIALLGTFMFVSLFLLYALGERIVLSLKTDTMQQGVVGLCVCLTFLLGLWFTFLLGLVGVIFGIKGLNQKGSRKVLAIVGTVANLLLMYAHLVFLMLSLWLCECPWDS